MTILRITRAFAGMLVLLSLALGVEASPVFQSSDWLWLALLVGLNQLQSGVTNWCLMDTLLRKLGVDSAPKKAMDRPSQRF